LTTKSHLIDYFALFLSCGSESAVREKRRHDRSSVDDKNQLTQTLAVKYLCMVISIIFLTGIRIDTQCVLWDHGCVLSLCMYARMSTKAQQRRSAVIRSSLDNSWK